jgi:hypothetical protein
LLLTLHPHSHIFPYALILCSFHLGVRLPE